MKTGRPPSPRTRLAAIARPVSCSRGRKNPGPHTKSSAQKTESGANRAVPSARAGYHEEPVLHQSGEPEAHRDRDGPDRQRQRAHPIEKLHDQAGIGCTPTGRCPAPPSRRRRASQPPGTHRAGATRCDDPPGRTSG